MASVGEREREPIVAAIGQGIEGRPADVRPALRRALGAVEACRLYGPTDLGAARRAFAACRADLVAVEASATDVRPVAWLIMAIRALAYGREREALTALSGIERDGAGAPDASAP